MSGKSLMVALRGGLSFLLGGVLMAAAWAKISDFGSFTHYLAYVRGIPGWLGAAAAVTIPSIEIALAAVLLCGAQKRVHLIALCSLMAVFLVYQILAAVPSLELAPAPCPCMGKLDPGSTWEWLVARGVLLFGLSLWRLRLERLQAPVGVQT